ncbi:MAG: S8 family peptidase [Alphaproteobacteria bacterium]
MELRRDPESLAPERLLVFEVRGSIKDFAAAIAKAGGLELIDEEELAADDEDEKPVVYLMVPDVRALNELVSLWRRWQNGKLVRGETPWGKVFERLRDLRPWGPMDRVRPVDGNFLLKEIDDRSDDDFVVLEVELVFRKDDHVADTCESEVRKAITLRNGRVISRSRLPDIAYHALLIELPVRYVREIIEHSIAGIAGLDPVMYVRPQAVATTLELSDPTEVRPSEPVEPKGKPILAILDGVPVVGHPLLRRHVIVDDLFELESGTPVTDRRHGTGMASVLIHGDRNRPGLEPVLPRKIHIVPVMGEGERFPPDRLIVDMIYRAVLTMRSGVEPTAPGVTIVNLSLGNLRRPFHGQMSAWARLLDRLAYQFGILFLVSAGNYATRFDVRAFPTSIAFESAQGGDRAKATLLAIDAVKAARRALSPAETVNGVTVGASNDDWVPASERRKTIIDPYPEMRISNPSSALGPGFARSVKPDVLMPGSREHVRVVGNGTNIDVEPAPASRGAGIKVAAPPVGGQEYSEAYTGGTSAATALASRTCHRIHDALEAAYGDLFMDLPHRQRAVLLKALLVHPARWPDAAASLIRATVGPPEGKYHSRQKDNIRRYFGYGFVDSDDAIACAEDRATFWAVGELAPDTKATIRVPVPIVMGGREQPHSMSATLAWFTPVSPGRNVYRAVRLELLKPKEEIKRLQVDPDADQPDSNQSNRGTVFSRRWTGDRAPRVDDDLWIPLTVQRKPDQGTPIDEMVPFGLAVTLTMPGVVEIYEQVRQRLTVAVR